MKYYVIELLPKGNGYYVYGLDGELTSKASAETVAVNLAKSRPHSGFYVAEAISTVTATEVAPTTTITPEPADPPVTP